MHRLLHVRPVEVDQRVIIRARVVFLPTEVAQNRIEQLLVRSVKRVMAGEIPTEGRVGGARRCVHRVRVDLALLFVGIVVQKLHARVGESGILALEVAHDLDLGVELVADHGVVVEEVDVPPVVAVGVDHRIAHHKALEIDLVSIREVFVVLVD